ncbi:MAG: LacI family DNA-binding transcriptional regulator [Pseudomonadota bacterium]
MTRKTRAPIGEAQDALYRLEDLAALAGVSISTVSRALNNSALVSVRTKQKIRAIAQAHNYAGRFRDRIAGGEPTRTISLVIPPPQGRDSRISDPFLLDLIGGVADALREKDADLLISHVMPTDYEGIMGSIGAGRTDGLIFLGQSTLHNHLNALARQGTPFVVWGAALPDQLYCSVGSDNQRGGHRATSHLLRLGRQRIAFLGDIDAPEAQLRHDGYREALREAGLAFSSELVQPAHFFVESAVEAVQILLERKTRFDAIFAASDLIAMGAIRGLMQAGVAVPKDVSVVGYDDIRMAAYFSPALTTIRQDVVKAGRLLVSKTLRMLEGEPVRSETLPTELIVRESCGA